MGVVRLGVWKMFGGWREANNWVGSILTANEWLWREMDGC